MYGAGSESSAHTGDSSVAAQYVDIRLQYQYQVDLLTRSSGDKRSSSFNPHAVQDEHPGLKGVGRDGFSRRTRECEKRQICMMLSWPSSVG